MADGAGSDAAKGTQSWRRIAARSFFIGLGLAVGAVGALSVWIWLASRPTPPTPWNDSALVAKGYPGFRALADTIELSYAIRNTTREDYSVEDVSRLRLFMRTVDDSALVLLERESVRTPLFIPAGESGLVDLWVRFAKTPRQALTESDSAFHEAVRMMLNEHGSNVQGFVLYDDETRYRIVLPRWRAHAPTKDQD